MGRPQSSAYGELGFELSKAGNKYAAICTLCHKRLINTAERRLRAHRNICKRPKPLNQGDLLQQFQTNQDETIYTIIDEHEVQDRQIEEIFFDDLSFESDPLNEVDTKFSKDDVLARENLPKHESNETRFASPRLKESPGSSKQFRFSPTSCNNRRTPLSLVSQANSKDTNRKSLPEMVDQLSDKEENDLNEALSKLIFGCNLPWTLVDSVYFKNFIGKIRPAYAKKIPSRKVLMTTLLENTYAKCISSGKRSASKNSVLLIDGWRHGPATTKYIVSMLYNTNGEKIFLQMWDFADIAQTAQFYDIVTKSLEMAKELYSTNVYAIVSDNSSEITEPSKLIQQMVWHSNCFSHSAHLFANDMLDRTLTDNVITVLKEFKQPDFENCIIEKGGTKLRLPDASGWYSYRDSYQCLVENSPYMQCLTIELKIKQNVGDLIFDDKFIEDVKDNVRIFDQIYKLIKACQSPDCSCADAVNLWLDINLLEFELELKSKLKSWMDEILNKYALAAFYLHPFYDNAKLSLAQQSVINNFLFDTLDSIGLEEWDSFRRKTSFFKKLYDKDIKKPLVFWNMAEMQHPSLSQLAIKLLRIPASSAQKHHDLWSYQHPDISSRNELTTERSKKLLHIYCSLRIADESKEDDDAD